TGNARGRNFKVSRAFSNQRLEKCSRACNRQLLDQRGSSTRPLPAHADCTQASAAAPFFRLYAVNTRYHSPRIVTALTMSINRRRPTTLPSAAMVLPPLWPKQVAKGRRRPFIFDAAPDGLWIKRL